MRRSTTLSVATLCCVAFTSPARADFVRWTADQYIASAGGNGYHVVDIYAVFDQSADRVLNVFDVTLDLIGANTATFYQASVPMIVGPSALPLPVPLDPSAYAYDTFVTIGALQGDLTNGTVADPTFDDPEILTFGTLTGCGWYNLPPSNGHGDAGVDLRVLVGRFAIEDQNWMSGARVTWTATCGHSSDNATFFVTDTRTFYYKPAIVTPAASLDDFTGDSKGDLVWENPTDGALHLWTLNGLSLVSDTTMSMAVPSAAWTMIGTGDIDGDGDPDLVMRDTAGAFVVWFIGSGDVDSTATISSPIPAAWTSLGVDDIDGDGRADLLFRNTTTNEVRGWLLDGQYRWRTGTIGSAIGLTFMGRADLNGDGRKDIIWRDGANSAITAWLLDGVNAPVSGPIVNGGAIASTWQLVAAPDLDGDGDEDLVWRNLTGGNVNGWIMNGLTKTSGGVISPGVALAWQPVGAMDLDGDGDDDIVWRNSVTNNVNGWIMAGLVKQSGGLIGPAPAAWVKLSQ